MGSGSTAGLVSDLLEKFVSDNLYKAVLDEDGEQASSVAASSAIKPRGPLSIIELILLAQRSACAAGLAPSARTSRRRRAENDRPARRRDQHKKYSPHVRRRVIAGTWCGSTARSRADSKYRCRFAGQ